MTPATTIFVRTYAPDAPWLEWLVKSIKRHVTGFDDIIFHCDHGDRAVIEPIISGTGRLVSSDLWTDNRYIQQQLCKLHCDNWVRTPYVLFADSDMAFCDPTTPNSFFRDGKPHLLVTPFDVLGSSVPWRETVERIAKERVEMESMRGPRLIHLTEAFPAFRIWITQNHGVSDVGRWLAQFPQLSEFNAIGWFVWKFCQDRYSFGDTTRESLPRNPIKQWWSRGGITPEVKMQLEACLA